MPYKARLKQSEPRKRKKPGYRVTNARAYNQSLRKRGMISLYVPGGDLKAQLINAKVRTPGVSGREPTYTTAYIELIYTFYRLFGWGMRQTTGYMEDYWATRGLDIPVPSSSQLCERFAVLQASVTQRCKQLARRLASGEAITMIVDSTGLSFGRASEWYEQKYGRKATQTPWRKMHLSIDADMNIHAIRITTTDVSDSEGMGALLPADLPVRCIGATLLTQKIASQECEGVIIANLINLWNAFGKPVCVKNA